METGNRAVDISVDLCGIPLKNPLIVAATNFGQYGKNIENIVLPNADPAAIETKAIFVRWLPRFARFTGPSKAWAVDRVGPGREQYPSEGYSFRAGGQGIKLSAEQWLAGDFAIATRAAQAKNSHIIVNGPSPVLHQETLDLFNSSIDGEIERMAELAAQFEEQGAAAVQALFHLAFFPGYSWQNWKVMPKIIGALRKALKIPVIVKVPYHIEFVEYVAKPLEAAGADAIICSGFTRITDIDIERARPSFTGYSGEASLSGWHQKPLAMWEVAESTRSGVKIPLIGAGGVNSARDVIAYVMVGATCVHLGTEAMFHGLSLFKKINRDLTNWLSAHGHTSLADIRGVALRKWGDRELKELDKVKMAVTESLCDGCGLCQRYCRESVVGAIRVVNKVARIDQEKCEQCTICELTCPQGAISVRDWPA